jgi:hypothetical protein
MKLGMLARSCCTTRAAMLFWAVLFVLIYGAGLLVRSMWPPVQPFGDTSILIALAAACFINFARNRTLHCGLTGPLIMVAAVAAALIEAGAWQLDMAIVWVVVLFGVGIAFAVEWRTVGRHDGSNASAG